MTGEEIRVIDPEKVYTADQLVEAFGKSPSTIYKACADCVIEGKKKGRKKLYSGAKAKEVALEKGWIPEESEVITLEEMEPDDRRDFVLAMLHYYFIKETGNSYNGMRGTPKGRRKEFEETTGKESCRSTIERIKEKYGATTIKGSGDLSDLSLYTGKKTADVPDEEALERAFPGKWQKPLEEEEVVSKEYSASKFKKRGLPIMKEIYRKAERFTLDEIDFIIREEGRHITKEKWEEIVNYVMKRNQYPEWVKPPLMLMAEKGRSLNERELTNKLPDMERFIKEKPAGRQFNLNIPKWMEDMIKHLVREEIWDDKAVEEISRKLYAVEVLF